MIPTLTKTQMSHRKRLPARLIPAKGTKTVLSQRTAFAEAIR
ncbi:hypothetical protein S1OALGB6SA_460 [Olavius algarvensis spirochete endosymbiont]|nr:hypothetical protein S1OALGB6SA_460 [Olavius algarvensis spirochete endosymbiont]